MGRSSRRADEDHILPAGAGGPRPLVAVVGRPNVGKSTLFNRLAGQQIAIVEDVPGVTRDRHYADANVLGIEYILVDTGGFDPKSDDPMAEGIASQVKLAVEECELVICVVDGTAEPTPADREAVQLLRRSDKPVLYVANKVDSPKQSLYAKTYYQLGIDNLFELSALHGQGIGAFEEALVAHLPKPASAPPPLGGKNSPRIAVIGRPNAGKSSLINHLLREDRLLVDDRPGTTVDSIDSLFRHGEEDLVLIDTAGMRRKRSVKGGVEGLGVLQSVRSMERSHAVILMIDAHRGPAEQDAKILGLAIERGRAMVIGLNKMDLLSEQERKEAMGKVRDVLSFVPWVPIVTVSAKTGRGVNKLLDTAVRVVGEHNRRVTTGQLNRFFSEVLEKHPPPTHAQRAVRLYFVTQAQVRPPTFVAVTNFPDHVHWSYQRYIVNQLRERFGFEGTPIRVRYRGRKRDE